MTTKTTVVGPNTTIISVSIRASLDDIIDAIEAEVVRTETVDGNEVSVHGWTLENKETNRISVFKSLNEDGVTAKYVRLRFDYPSVNRMTMEAYSEYEGTPVAGRMAFDSHIQGGGTGGQSFNVTQRLRGSAIFRVGVDRFNIVLHLNPRWFALNIQYIQTDNKYWQYNEYVKGVIGLFETSRDFEGDTVDLNVPPLVLTHTGFIPYNYVGSHGVFSRSIANPVVNWPMEFQSIHGKNTHLYVYTPNTKNPISGAYDCLDLWAREKSSESIRGRVHGLKMYSRADLNLGDTVEASCDSRFFSDPNGESTRFFVIPSGRLDYLRTYGSTYSSRFLLPA